MEGRHINQEKHWHRKQIRLENQGKNKHTGNKAPVRKQPELGGGGILRRKVSDPLAQEKALQVAGRQCKSESTWHQEGQARTKQGPVANVSAKPLISNPKTLWGHIQLPPL